MPTPVDKLTPKSTAKEISQAISACIGDEMESGRARSQDQAIAMCFNMAEQKTGKKIGRGGA